MERVIYIEVLDRRGRVVERTRVESLPATIGRAYSNDVIISDRFVSPTHVVIRASGDDGGLVIEDVGSVNGLYRPGQTVPVDIVVMESGLRLRLGETMVRFVAADHLVAPADVLPPISPQLFEAFRKPRVALALVIATLLIFTADIYLETYYDFSWSAMLGPGLVGVAALSLWAGVWAFANRLLTHRFAFQRHLALACIASISSIALLPLSEYAEFVFSSAVLALVLGMAIQAALVALVAYGHLSIVPVGNERRRRVWALSVTMIVLGIAGLFSQSERDDFSSDVEITTPLRSVGAHWVPAVTTDEFLERSRRTKTLVDDTIARAQSDER